MMQPHFAVMIMSFLTASATAAILKYDYDAYCVSKSVPRTVGYACFHGFDPRIAHPKSQSHFEFLKSADGKGEL